MSDETQGALFAGVAIIAAWTLTGIIIRPEWFGF